MEEITLATTKNDKAQQPESPKNKKVQQEKKFGILGKDLSSKYFSRAPSKIKPTTYGGRNGNGKP